MDRHRETECHVRLSVEHHFSRQNFVDKPRCCRQLLLQESMDLRELCGIFPDLLQQGDTRSEREEGVPEIVMNDLPTIHLLREASVDAHVDHSLSLRRHRPAGR